MYPVEEYRNLKEDILSEYGVFFSPTFFTDHSYTKSRIGFPIIFKGRLIGADLRTTKVGERIKWLRQPRGLSCGHALYNYDKVAESDTDYVVLVEGIIDALNLIQMDIPTLATFGASITNEQRTLIEGLGVDVYIMYDNDEAGKKGVEQVYGKLKFTTDCYEIQYDVSDPGECTDREQLLGSIKSARRLR